MSIELDGFHLTDKRYNNRIAMLLLIILFFGSLNMFASIHPELSYAGNGFRAIVAIASLWILSGIYRKKVAAF